MSDIMKNKMTEKEYFDRDVANFLECMIARPTSKIGAIKLANDRHGINPANPHPSEMRAFNVALTQFEAL